MGQFKVVITDFGTPENELEDAELRASGLNIDLVRLNAKTPQELLPHILDADALIVQWTKIPREIIQSLTKCKVISRYGIGVDMIDLVAAGEHGIMVCNTPDYCIDEVSTHTLTFVLMLNRQILPQIGTHTRVNGGHLHQPRPHAYPPRLSAWSAWATLDVWWFKKPELLD